VCVCTSSMVLPWNFLQLPPEGNMYKMYKMYKIYNTYKIYKTYNTYIKHI
jgi:hypothetical protein